MKDVLKYVFFLSLFAKANAACSDNLNQTGCCEDTTCAWKTYCGSEECFKGCRMATECADDIHDFGQNDRCDCNPEYTFETDCLTKYPEGDENRKFCYCLMWHDSNCDAKGTCHLQTWWADAGKGFTDNMADNCLPPGMKRTGGWWQQSTTSTQTVTCHINIINHLLLPKPSSLLTYL